MRSKPKSTANKALLSDKFSAALQICRRARRCPDNMTQCSSGTVNGKESGWRKAEKAAIPLYRDSGGHSVAMSDPSLYTAVRRSFSIFHRPEFSLHLHALLRRAVCIAGQPVAKSHTRASTSGA